jgi:hypothetical protein
MTYWNWSRGHRRKPNSNRARRKDINHQLAEKLGELDAMHRAGSLGSPVRRLADMEPAKAAQIRQELEAREAQRRAIRRAQEAREGKVST